MYNIFEGGETMNFDITSKIIEELKPYIKDESIAVSLENKDWKKRDYKSDLVTIDEKNNVGFEVFDNEIIVYYFTDHCHFEDYSSEFDEVEDNYIKRAIDFLAELLQYKICHQEYYRGKSLYSEKYYIIYDDDRKNKCIGTTWYGLSKFINPFGKRSRKSTIRQYNKSKGYFTNSPPKTPSLDAIEVIDISEDLYIEIYKKNNMYSYVIMEKDFDEYDGMLYYYWTPSVKTAPSGFYDTKDKAVKSAMETLNYRGC